MRRYAIAINQLFATTIVVVYVTGCPLFLEVIYFTLNLEGHNLSYKYPFRDLIYVHCNAVIIYQVNLSKINIDRSLYSIATCTKRDINSVLRWIKKHDGIKNAKICTVLTVVVCSVHVT